MKHYDLYPRMSSVTRSNSTSFAILTGPSATLKSSNPFKQMLTEQVKDSLFRLRRGEFDASLALPLEQLSAKAFVEDLASYHPFVFQKREIGRKTEIGVAAAVVYQLVFRKKSQSGLYGAQVYPILRSCYLVSAYDDEISEVTWAANIRARPMDGDGRGLTLSLGAGFKLDKTIDGWRVTPLVRRRTNLSKEVLEKHGWQFEALPPFAVKAPVT
jgi:hypothetical protein